MPWGMGCACVHGTGFQPSRRSPSDTWGVAPGWFENTPLAPTLACSTCPDSKRDSSRLRVRRRFWIWKRGRGDGGHRAKGPFDTSMGQRPMSSTQTNLERQRRSSSGRCGSRCRGEWCGRVFMQRAFILSFCRVRRRVSSSRSSLLSSPPHLNPLSRWGRGNSPSRPAENRVGALNQARVSSPSPPSGERGGVRGRSGVSNRRFPLCAPSAPSARARSQSARLQARRVIDDSRNAAPWACLEKADTEFMWFTD